MLERYIKENNIIGLQLKDFSNLSKEIKVKLDKEIITKKIEIHWFWRFINIIIFLASILVTFILILELSKPQSYHPSSVIPDQEIFITFGIVFFLLLLSVYTFKKIIKKPKIIEEHLPEIEKSKRLDQEMLLLLSKYRQNLLGKIYNSHKNEITGNIKKEYIGEAYISFPDNSLDKHSLMIMNMQEYYSAYKTFNISDIVVCKEYQVNYDESDYNVDTSGLEIASRRADIARTERSTSRSAGVNQGLLTNISQDRKIIAVDNARRDLEKKVKEISKKKKDETIFLILSFKDGSEFHINHIDKNTLYTLQHLIENN